MYFVRNIRTMVYQIKSTLDFIPGISILFQRLAVCGKWRSNQPSVFCAEQLMYARLMKFSGFSKTLMIDQV